MNKNEENKLADAIITLHQEIKKQGENTEKQFAKVNLALGEMRLSYMKLDESFNKYAQRNDDRATNHETRIVRLESREGRDNMVSEPHAVYKKTKKKK